MHHRVAAIAAANLIALCASALPPTPPSRAAAAVATEFASRNAVVEWMEHYRQKPEPWRLPGAVRALSEAGALRDPEAAGFAVGFTAAVLAANRHRADQLVDSMLPLPPGDQWLVVRAIAYSGLPSWKSMLARLCARLPQREAMIDGYLGGALPPLDAIELDQSPGMLEKLRIGLGGRPNVSKVSYGNNPELIDVLWGLYFATGQYRPIWRMITLLPWSKDNESVARLNAGSAAKYTLASNAARYPDLLLMLKTMAPYQEPTVKPLLDEVIRAAETMEASAIKKRQLALLEDLKRKGPGYQRDMKLWGYVGQGTIAIGCIVAASMSLTALGLPCVIGGAATSAALGYVAAQ